MVPVVDVVSSGPVFTKDEDDCCDDGEDVAMLVMVLLFWFGDAIVRGTKSVSGESVRKSLGLNVSENAKIMLVIGSRSIF